jgi:hypothetical protein
MNEYNSGYDSEEDEPYPTRDVSADILEDIEEDLKPGNLRHLARDTMDLSRWFDDWTDPRRKVR